MRFLWELFKPALKCDRLGHKKAERKYKIYAEPKSHGWLSGVADRAVLTRDECKRCGTVLSEGEITDRHAIDSLSMPSSEYDKFEKNGVYICHEI